MTEEEAKTKWCPHSGTAMDHPHGGCIGSKCMAWRWLPAYVGDLIQAIKDYRAQHGCDLLTAKNAVEAARREHSRSGGCGLAGAPQ